MRGLDFDDPLWDDLLDELTADEIYNTIGVSGYGIEYIDSVEKPFNIDADTAAGLLYGGTGAMFPNAMTLAQTWNLDLASEYGTMIVMLCVWCLFRVSYITVTVHFIPDICVIFWAYPLTWSISSVIFLALFLRGKWVYGFEKRK